MGFREIDEILELERAEKDRLKKEKESVRKFLAKHQAIDVELDDRDYMTEEEKREEERSIGGPNSW